MSDERPILFGVPVDALSLEETVSRCAGFIEERRFVQHVVLNAGKVVMMDSDGGLREIIANCALVNADGMSVVWAGRVLGVSFPERVAGIDLMMRLLALCAEREWPVYVLGATPEVLAAFIETCETEFPRLRIAGSHDGYFDDDGPIVSDIRDSGARLLVVGMPSPRKERFLWQHGAELGQLFAMGVGGSLDVVAGRTKRAPVWMQRSGLEWAYRLAQEPGRMWRRYLVGNVRFVGIVIREFARRLTSRRT